MRLTRTPENRCLTNIIFILLLIAFLLSTTRASGQDLHGDSLQKTSTRLYHKSVGFSVNGTGKQSVPFWMRSNRYGSVPLAGASVSLYGELGKEYSSAKKLIDWGGNINVRMNVGSKFEFIPVEAYLKGRLSVFELKAGRSRDHEGLNDPVLSTGSFTLSGNAPGIPKVQIGIPEYYVIPVVSGLFAFKGNASYGWMGDVPIQYGDVPDMQAATKYHHLSFYGRLGKPEAKWKLYAAVHHDVVWGSDKAIFGDQYDLSWSQELWHVISGKAYAPPTGYQGKFEISKVGNHLGAIDFGAEYEFKQFRVNVYRQFFYDKGAIAYLANVKDGLTGLVFTNTTKDSNPSFRWNKILAEFFYSKHQAGDYGTKKTPSGPEYYYNHAVYSEGFSYNGFGLGTPLIIPAKDASSGNINHPLNYFISNRVVAGHIGAQVDVREWQILVKATFARHHGDYRTSGPYEQWFNGKLRPQHFNMGRFDPVNQFSLFLQGSKEVFQGIHISGVLALDQGGILEKNVGGLVKISKHF
ncbi:hypothetical protein HP439_00880 [Sphingobacterium shayense]|uniref:capsule assembly Wzi family protein n=1 Tax=Sphingobacterium shayense TaxID=626343 RepID=UPI0015546716|nr:capsule assembly Wzi family protein [Sphingobacterium shayense]NQD69275.1 hypothetical protein [Sphingobacterium shayense]